MDLSRSAEDISQGYLCFINDPVFSCSRSARHGTSISGGPRSFLRRVFGRKDPASHRVFLSAVLFLSNNKKCTFSVVMRYFSGNHVLCRLCRAFPFEKNIELRRTSYDIAVVLSA